MFFARPSHLSQGYTILLLIEGFGDVILTTSNTGHKRDPDSKQENVSQQPKQWSHMVGWIHTLKCVQVGKREKLSERSWWSWWRATKTGLVSSRAAANTWPRCCGHWGRVQMGVKSLQVLAPPKASPSFSKSALNNVGSWGQCCQLLRYLKRKEKSEFYLKKIPNSLNVIK